MTGNIVAIVGRPNVGKSTLFNRLVEKREAIVDSTIGVTRDRHYGRTEWNGVEYSVIDTGGYIMGSDDKFEGEIRKQVKLAIDEANVVVFVVDVVDGVTDMDKTVANLLRNEKKPVVLVVNKVDSNSRRDEAFEFYELGLGDFHSISSINGSGTGDLLDDVVSKFENLDEINYDDNLPKFAIVGRPNAGKSTMINALLGEERNIVTDMAGTTRDSLQTKYHKYGHEFYLIDTAGIRKKTKVKDDLEFYSVMRSIRSIESCDVCLLMIDATRGLEGQDLSIIQLAITNKKGIVILINKWDLVENKETNTIKKVEDYIRGKMAPFTDVPIVFVSALTKQRILKAIEEAVIVHENRVRKIRTSVLNEVMLPIIENYPPPATKGKYIKIKFVSQLPTYTPKFVFFANLPQYVREPYKRFLENKLRDNFDFNGVPIEVFIRQK